MEKISMIVSVYNRLSYLRNVIFCLLDQTKNIDELVIADDGSYENILDYIKDLIPFCSFKIKHVKQQDLGFRLARSRNNAARVSEGDFLIFIDQDIIFPNNFVERLYNNRGEKILVSSRAIISTLEESKQVFNLIRKGFNYSQIYLFFQKDRKGISKAIRKDKINTFLFKCKLRKRGAKIAGLIFALYKSDFVAINGFDEEYIGWGEEDDDFCNRFYKYTGSVRMTTFKEYSVHLYHNFDDSKRKSLNREYYLKRKKEITKNNYKSTYGYAHSLGEDKYELEVLK